MLSGDRSVSLSFSLSGHRRLKTADRLDDRKRLESLEIFRSWMRNKRRAEMCKDMSNLLVKKDLKRTNANNNWIFFFPRFPSSHVWINRTSIQTLISIFGDFLFFFFLFFLWKLATTSPIVDQSWGIHWYASFTFFVSLVVWSRVLRNVHFFLFRKKKGIFFNWWHLEGYNLEKREARLPGKTHTVRFSVLPIM